MSQTNGSAGLLINPAPGGLFVRRQLVPSWDRQMKRPLRIVLTLLAIIVIPAPLSVVITILLFPFWSWLEASAGVESVGHSGPAEWCYAVVFFLLVTGAALTLLARQRGR